MLSKQITNNYPGNKNCEWLSFVVVGDGNCQFTGMAAIVEVNEAWIRNTAGCYL
jgi:hypothetical protein